MLLKRLGDRLNHKVVVGDFDVALFIDFCPRGCGCRHVNGLVLYDYMGGRHL